MAMSILYPSTRFIRNVHQGNFILRRRRRDVFATSSRRRRDVVATSSRRLEKKVSLVGFVTKPNVTKQIRHGHVCPGYKADVCPGQKVRACPS